MSNVRLETWESSPAELLEHTATSELMQHADPADLLAFWKVAHNREALFKENLPQIVWQAREVWLRANMLVVMEKVGLLSEWTHDGEVDQFVFRVMAEIPLKRMKPSVRYSGLHQYVLNEIRKAADEDSQDRSG